jgi:cytochrome c553
MNERARRKAVGSKASAIAIAPMQAAAHFLQDTACVVLMLLLVTVGSVIPALAGDKMEPGGLEKGRAAELSYGGRLYDNHWGVMGMAAPVLPNPAYPADPADAPNSTWRCVSCHGWDYAGSKGHLGQKGQLGEAGAQFTGIRDAKGRPPEEITEHLRSPTHRQITEGLSDEAMKALSLFVCCGQHDIAVLLGPNGEGIGDPMQGKDIYEGVCARCHQADGKASIYGEKGDMSSLGWIARERPQQAIHKIINGVPSADMLALRFLGDDGMRDLITYLQSLDAQ